jgi:hypothetical protein
MVRTVFVVRDHSTRGTRNFGSSRLFSAISEMAAASRRKSISKRTDSASVSTTATGRSRREAATFFSRNRAAA